MDEKTIIAVITPPGEGAISVIRLSGEDSIPLVDKYFRGKQKISNVDTHTVHYGKMIYNDNEIIDDVLVTKFQSPNSYTGEDCIEISTHGSPIITQKVIQLFLTNNDNIRLAEPGEYTKRAFLNGKIDLSQAEAVADIINSRTEASLRGARNQFEGTLSKKIGFLKKNLVDIISLVELKLDFAEECIEFVSSEEIKKRINDVIVDIENLLETYKFGKVIREGLNVAIVGEANVGKSSLLNYLLKDSRAIVSEIPGTTRDIIKEEISINGYLFKLFDTAGIREAKNEIERQGVERSRNAVKNADIILFVNDITSGFANKLFYQLLELTDEDKILNLFNKIDLMKETQKVSGIAISAKTGEGIENLLLALKEKAVGSRIYSEKGTILVNIRHYKILKKTKKYLSITKKAINKKLSEEFISIGLRNAISVLGEIIGEVTTDDILNNIFSKFCIGK